MKIITTRMRRDYGGVTSGGQEYVARVAVEAELEARDMRIAELEAALRELLDAFNPEPRVYDRDLIWGRAASALTQPTE